MRRAFRFNSSACSGCKTCQVACKGKNDLPTGVLWRRVYEISAGTWVNDGAAWTTDVFAYNISMACNHCDHPICAGVCPTKAYEQRKDGLVILDPKKCVGCQYCSWACPYGAPQYDRTSGRMTKCDFCLDYLEQGKPPACVAACPMRVLDHGDPQEFQHLENLERGIFPMAQVQVREPNFFISRRRPGEDDRRDARIMNQEEVSPVKTAAKENAPLVAFSLLAQMAVGASWAISLAGLSNELFGLWTCIGVLLLLAAGFSFGHLGTKRNAWRVLANLRHSWLSREILMLGLFGAGWSLTTLLHWQWGLGAWPAIVTGLLGVFLVFCMAQVYRFRTIPAWYPWWRIPVSFFLSSGILGLILLNSFMHPSWTHWLLPVLLGGQLVLLLAKPARASQVLRRLQAGLLATGLAGQVLLPLLPGTTGWMGVFLILVVLSAELVGRWRFYGDRSNLM